MNIDVSKIKVGDTITLVGTVTEIDSKDSEMPVEIDGFGWVMTDQIIGHTPRPFKEGDLVRLRSAPFAPGQTMKVESARGDVLWIRPHDLTTGMIVNACDVERA
jgi:transcription antitermination factor NusG